MTKRAPIVAAIIALGMTIPMASAQLPQTNMGKYVHKPGDNQYDHAAQQERHPPPPPPQVQRFATSGGNGGGYFYQPKPKPRKPDPSIEPIAADEPVPPAGFPVLPERLELPIAMGSWGGASSGGGGGGSAWNGPQGGGGAADDGPPRMLKKSQGYAQFEPGAFIPKSHKSSYYKCNEVTPPRKQVSDQIMTGGPGGGGDVPGMGGPPSPAGALRSLGKEPKLNDREDGATAPDAPQPVVINQSTTQDLSLPEDDFTNNSAKRPGKAGMKMKQIGRRVVSPINSASRRFTGVSLF